LCFPVTIFGGIDNVGKTWIVWYLRVLAAMYHGHKTLILSSENEDYSLKRKIIEFYLNKKYENTTAEERKDGNVFYREYFRIISSSVSIYNAKDILDIGTEMYLREWGHFDCFVVEPYNSLDVDGIKDSEYRYHYRVLSKLRLFTKRYCSIWIAAHVHSAAARSRDSNGMIRVPMKSDLEYGQQFANRTDDFVMVHRLVNHPDRYRETQLHVQKIKETETGGRPTPFDEPVILKLNDNNCGFRSLDSNNLTDTDPIEEWWKKKRPSEREDPLKDMFGSDPYQTTEDQPF